MRNPTSSPNRFSETVQPREQPRDLRSKMAVLRACRLAKSPTSRQLLRFQRAFSIVRLSATLRFSQHDGWSPKSWILRRNQISFAEFGNGKLARFVWIKMPRAVWAGHYLFIDFVLQSDEGMQQRFRTRRTTR